MSKFQLKRKVDSGFEPFISITCLHRLPVYYTHCNSMQFVCVYILPFARNGSGIYRWNRFKDYHIRHACINQYLHDTSTTHMSILVSLWLPYAHVFRKIYAYTEFHVKRKSDLWEREREREVDLRFVASEFYIFNWLITVILQIFFVTCVLCLGWGRRKYHSYYFQRTTPVAARKIVLHDFFSETTEIFKCNNLLPKNT